MKKTGMPIGFIITIFQNKDALKYFANLDENTKQRISDYIQNVTTGEESKEKIYNSIQGLANQNVNFLI
ncbi:MAG: hypothetical protein PHD15_06125 [Clostridia bacterium]|nr:hypothetical protein [Clostridia bacterium]MDD4387307.1 hypothetical protein [Clostridia bacterium]